MPIARLIIDVQAAMTTGQWEVFESRQMIGRINHVARLVRAAGEPVIVIQHEEAAGPMQHDGRGWLTLVADAHSTIDNGVLSAAQISAHHNVTLASLDSYGPRVRAVPAADVRLTEV